MIQFIEISHKGKPMLIGVAHIHAVVPNGDKCNIYVGEGDAVFTADCSYEEFMSKTFGVTRVDTTIT